MRGHVRRRGQGWAYVADAGRQPAIRCEQCSKRVWVERGQPPEVCPAKGCGGRLGEPRSERRQVWSSGYRTRKEAEAALRIFLGRVETGADPFPEKMTVGEWADRWISSERVQTLRPQTRSRYLAIVRDDIRPVLGSMELSSVRPRHVNLVLEQARARGLAPRSVMQVRAIASSMLRAAVDAELIDSNPVSSVRVPRVERPKLSVPTPEELVALITASRGTTWEIPLLLAATTGMRRSEVLALTWSNVDLEGGRLRVVASLQRTRDTNGSRLEIHGAKTDRARREIALPTFAADRLRTWRREQLERRIAAGAAWVDHDLVCEGGDGRPLDPDAFSNGFKRLAKAAGLQANVRLHDVRHGVATALLARGVHPAIASAVLGHSRVAFTMDTYQHVTDGMTAAAAEALNQALGG